MMPDMTGLDVYQRLKDAGWLVDRFIFMSGGIFLRAVESGAHGAASACFEARVARADHDDASRS